MLDRWASAASSTLSPSVCALIAMICICVRVRVALRQWKKWRVKGVLGG
jgi:hypothetical protein